MKKLFITLLFTIAFSTNSFADNHGNDDSDKSAAINELFVVMEADQMIDMIYQQMEQMFNNVPTQMGITDDEMSIYTVHRKKLNEVMRSEMSWDKMRPGLHAVYSQNFSKEEINGLLNFYKTPAGQAFIKKMPAVTQQSMQLGQQMAMQAMPKIQAVSQELSAALTEYRANKNSQ